MDNIFGLSRTRNQKNRTKALNLKKLSNISPAVGEKVIDNDSYQQ